jgi:hypothetical protein
MNLQDIMRALYASEINCQVASFWDGGWRVSLGDPMNGFIGDDCYLDTLEKVAVWLDEAARKHYPNSAYARTK